MVKIMMATYSCFDRKMGEKDFAPAAGGEIPARLPCLFL